jgi:hypothetical protein
MTTPTRDEMIQMLNAPSLRPFAREIRAYSAAMGDNRAGYAALTVLAYWLRTNI